MIVFSWNRAYCKGQIISDTEASVWCFSKAWAARSQSTFFSGKFLHKAFAPDPWWGQLPGNIRCGLFHDAKAWGLNSVEWLKVGCLDITSSGKFFLLSPDKVSLSLTRHYRNPYTAWSHENSIRERLLLFLVSKQGRPHGDRVGLLVGESATPWWEKGAGGPHKENRGDVGRGQSGCETCQ